MKPSDRIKQLAGVLPTEGTSPAERLVVATLAYLDEQAADNEALPPPLVLGGFGAPGYGPQPAPEPQYGHAFPGRLPPSPALEPLRVGPGCTFDWDSLEGRLMLQCEDPAPASPPGEARGTFACPRCGNGFVHTHPDCPKCGGQTSGRPNIVEPCPKCKDETEPSAHPASTSPPSEDKPLTTMPRDYDHGLTSKSAWEAQAVAEYDRGRRDGRSDVGKYANAIGRIECAIGLVGARPLDETVKAVESMRAELTRLKAENARLSGELLNSVELGRHDAVFERLSAALASGASYAAKYHAARREVRRLNAALRAAYMLLAKDKADRAAYGELIRHNLDIQEGRANGYRNQLTEAQRTIASLEAELVTLTGVVELLSPKFKIGQRVRSVETGRELVIETITPHEYTVCDGPTYEAHELEALDQPSQPEPASEPRAPSATAREVCGHLLQMYWLYSNYRVDSRGPVGLIRRITELLWPELDAYIEAHHFEPAREKFFPSDHDEPATHPERASEPRAIVVGSKWQSKLSRTVRTVTELSSVAVGFSEDCGYSDVWDRALFRTKHTWLSDPPVSETAEGGEK